MKINSVNITGTIVLYLFSLSNIINSFIFHVIHLPPYYQIFTALLILADINAISSYILMQVIPVSFTALFNPSAPITEDIYVCAVCNRVRYKNTHHCKLCQQCVDQFDHHCNFLTKCIGKSNYHMFIKFTVSSFWSNLLSVIIAVLGFKNRILEWIFLVLTVIGLIFNIFVLAGQFQNLLQNIDMVQRKINHKLKKKVIYRSDYFVNCRNKFGGKLPQRVIFYINPFQKQLK